jgi:hypothetical protein
MKSLRPRAHDLSTRQDETLGRVESDRSVRQVAGFFLLNWRMMAKKCGEVKEKEGETRAARWGEKREGASDLPRERG